MQVTTTQPRPPAGEVGVSEWSVWTTTARVVVTDASELAAARALTVDYLERVDRAASRFRGDSEVSRLAAGRAAVNEVSPLLAELLTVALAAATQTDGALDPTLGHAMQALGYDRDLEVVRHGEPRGVLAVHRPVDWRAIRLEGARLSMPPGTLLDLGATAKAYAADQCAEAIARELGCGVLVSLGGDVRVCGPAPAGGWCVLVQDGPDQPSSSVLLTGARAVATSSTLRRTWRRDGELLHHVLDPVLRRPAPSVWRTVSVAAQTCLRANTLSTAAVVRGHGAPALLEDAALPARLVSADGSVLRLGGWPS